MGVRAKVAKNAFERMRGLIGRPPPAPGEGLLIPKCNAIHTFFMKYPIDAVFLDRENRVVKAVRGIRPSLQQRLDRGRRRCARRPSSSR